MKISYGSLVLISFVFVVNCKSTCGPGQILDLNGDCIKKFTLPERKSCPIPEIRFGAFDLKSGGRIAEFYCESGWTIAGAGHAMCRASGEWDRSFPFCVRPGCEEINISSGVIAVSEMDGALLRFDCKNNVHTLIGPAVIGCDGSRWNGSSPHCSTFSERNEEEKVEATSTNGAINYALLPQIFIVIGFLQYLM